MKKHIILSLSILTVMMSCADMETTQPVRADLVDAVFASGFVISEEEYQVTANTDGYLTQRFVSAGTEVDSQTPLFQLSNAVQQEQLVNAEVNYQDALEKLKEDAPQRVQLRLQIEQAKSQMEVDKANYERYQKLWEIKAVSKVEYDQVKLQYENALINVEVQEKNLEDLLNSLELSAKNAESQLAIQRENHADYFLTSEMNGEVLKVFKEQGELVRRGEVVALIGGGARRAKLFVSEEDIRWLALGQKVVFSLNTNKEERLEGKVAKIYPSFDEAEQSFVVEASFSTLNSPIYHSTQLQANIIVGEVEDALVIPSQFLLEGDSVCLRGGKTMPIRVGLRNDQWVEVIEGIESSDVLINPTSL